MGGEHITSFCRNFGGFKKISPTPCHINNGHSPTVQDQICYTQEIVSCPGDVEVQTYLRVWANVTDGHTGMGLYDVAACMVVPKIDAGAPDLIQDCIMTTL